MSPFGCEVIGRQKALLIAWFWPVFSGLRTYGVAWILASCVLPGLPLVGSMARGDRRILIGISIAGMPALQAFELRLLACLFFSIPACVQSFGEEVGWRGYLLTRLFDAKVPVPIFWNGLIWGLWHVPFFLAWVPSRGLPEQRSISLFFFVANTIAGAYLLSYLRLRSGSIWPPVLAHASGNTMLLWAFQGLTAASPFWKGEFSLLFTGLPVLILLIMRPAWTVHYWPRSRDDDGSISASAKLSSLS